jgi:pyruvate dehydrogenase E2 component (dihydrolipoamide acetyltransferase)
MATVVRMPSVLAGASEAVLARWLVAPGERVTAGTPVAEIETEKAVVEYQAEDTGTVGRLILAEGESGQIGDPILVLLADGETDADAVLGTVAEPAAAPAQAAASPGGLASAAAGPAAAPVANGHRAEAGLRGRIFASPLVRKIAGEQGIDLAAIEGTGPNGRITRRDLEDAAARRSAAPPQEVPQASPAAASPRAKRPPRTSTWPPSAWWTNCWGCAPALTRRHQ